MKEVAGPGDQRCWHYEPLVQQRISRTFFGMVDAGNLALGKVHNILRYGLHEVGQDFLDFRCYVRNIPVTVSGTLYVVNYDLLVE